MSAEAIISLCGTVIVAGGFAVAAVTLSRQSHRDTATNEVTAALLRMKDEILERIEQRMDRYALKEWVEQALKAHETRIAALEERDK